MKDTNRKLLIIGIGNIGRQDDGLAWALLDRLKRLTDINTTLHYAYQLNIEHAEKIAQYQKVIFIDASHNELSKGFLWSDCEEKSNYEFTSHSLEPNVIFTLSNELYHSENEVNILQIQGYDWELKEGITTKAKLNLERAFDFLMDEHLIENRHLELQE